MMSMDKAPGEYRSRWSQSAIGSGQRASPATQAGSAQPPCPSRTIPMDVNTTFA